MANDTATKSATHTALPWRLTIGEGDRWICDNAGNTVAVVQGKTPNDANKWFPEAAERAALIVRAVNAHAELVEALRKAEEVIPALCELAGITTDEAVAALDAARAILAKIEVQ